MDGSDLKNIVFPLLEWYSAHKRSLPWRENKDPYRIWVSEIMLQQTRVDTVIPYFERFVSELPDAASLAVCPLPRLQKLWEGLGYYSRVRNMQQAAIQVMDEFGGELPRTRAQLLTLKGIGDYTAGAIASIAWQEPVPAVDGNVMRVIARLICYPQDILKASAKKEITAMLEKVIPPDRPGEFNQSLMELGALVCVPGHAPACGDCPLGSMCEANLQQRQDQYPLRLARTRQTVQHRTILLIQDGGRTALRKRPVHGLLAGLYEPVNLEGSLSAEQALDWTRQQGLAPLFIERLPDSRHLFSHLEWRMSAYRIRVASFETDPPGLIFADRQEAGGTYAIPSAFQAYRNYYKEVPS
ncbi:MAG: A/G-specific adenine glycosylase [Blautia sp.]|nr:A/G-specific adenine glycosylase [Blautia sp.]